MVRVGEITERITVIGEAPLVETTSSAVSGLVDERTIRDLPLNGRSFEQLAALNPLVAVSRNSENSATAGRTTKLTIGGARPNMISFLLDGTNVLEARAVTPGSVAGTFLGVDTVREFKVLANSYSAEYAGGAGAVITAVTKSGTNELHGSVFYFHRNDNLDARNFFDPGDKPEFKRNQFGFVMGGPIRRDRSFFFGSYEGLRERIGTTEVRTVPNLLARDGFLPDRRTGQLEFVGINPSVKPYIDLYPAPNGRDFGDGTAEFLFSFSQPTDEDYFVAKIDHTFSGTHSAFVRYTISDSVARRQAESPMWQQIESARNQYVTIEDIRIFSPALLNTFRFGFNRSVNLGVNDPLINIPESLNLVPEMQFGSSGTIAMGRAVAELGGASRLPRLSFWNLFEWSDDVTHTRGAHSIKAGMIARRLQHNGGTPSDASGSFLFGGLRDFLQGQARTFSAALPEGDAWRGLRQSYLGFYVQDDFRAAPGLTLNLGLRYEFTTGPREVNDKFANWEPNAPEPTVRNPLFPTPSLTDFGPRVGFAWDPTGTGRTAIRGGFGIFYAPMFGREVGHATKQPPFDVLAELRNPPFPNAFEVFVRGPQFITPRPTSVGISGTNSLMQYNLSLERQLGESVVFTVGYAGSLGRHLFRLLQVNMNEFVLLPDGRKFFPRDARPMNPALSDHKLLVTDGNSSYNAFLASVQRRFAPGVQIQASYTLAKSIDDNSQTFNLDFGQAPGAMDAFCRRCDRGLSTFDVRHNFVTNFTYDLPALRSATGGLGKVLNGWQLNGIVSLSSGIPFSITNNFNRANSGTRGSISCCLTDRPNLRPGRTKQDIVLGGPDRYYDPSAFELQPAGFFGNFGRNVLIGPGFANVDLGVAKNTALNGEGTVNLQFRAEAFNLFNRANFRYPNRVIFADSRGVPVGNAGRITETVNTSRQIQFGLKLIF